MWFITQAPRLIQAPYGLATTGYGAEEDTYINGDIGQGHVAAVLMFVVTGLMAHAAMRGTEDIGGKLVGGFAYENRLTY